MNEIDEFDSDAEEKETLRKAVIYVFKHNLTFLIISFVVMGWAVLGFYSGLYFLFFAMIVNFLATQVQDRIDYCNEFIVNDEDE
jgi:uncharacterized ion transporter superfamily protein YfcC